MVVVVILSATVVVVVNFSFSQFSLFAASTTVVVAPAAMAVVRLDDLLGSRINQPFKLNNTALKWIRDTHEDPPGCPTQECVDLTALDPLQIGVLERDQGMSYSFQGDATQPWSWRQMLNGLRADILETIVGNGVVRITCEAMKGSSDHKRNHAAKKAGQPYPEATE